MTTQAVWNLPAKANRKNPDEWLPLWMYLRDTAAVMDYLISVWLPDSVKKAIDPAGNEEQLWRTAVFLGVDPAHAGIIWTKNTRVEEHSSFYPLDGQGRAFHGKPLRRLRGV